MERSSLPFARSAALLVCSLIFEACNLASTRTPAGSDQDAAMGPGGAAGGSGGGSGGVSGTVGDAGGPPRACVGLQCQQTTCSGPSCTVMACAAGTSTTLSGTVYDPAGKVPLYNVNVYVPNAALAPLTEGASCDRCDTPVSGSPVVIVQTDAKGNFTLPNPPVGSNIPLVIQVGKWRRELKVPAIMPCMDNALTDKNLTRLPRNQSEGHIPKIALTTGGADALECLLRKIGLDDAEFTPEAGTGRVNLFNGEKGADHYDATLNAGAMFTPAPTWWETKDHLMNYDMVLHSCEGVERSTNKSVAARQALQDYSNAGGRVFASHWHNYWLEFGPAPWPTMATFHHAGSDNDIVSSIDTTFPKGVALADWLVNVGGSTTRGQLAISGAKHTVDAVNPAVAQRWIYNDTIGSVQYLTANAPVGVPAAMQCGRIVFSDIHVSAGAGGIGDDSSSPKVPFPTGCVTTDLSPQEKALEFMLFDLSSCIMPDVPPIP